ncbi:MULTISPECIES: formate dehydrogenase accessory sulfurtransferase FdhD [Acinetobacter]|uniref:formate dehydrogenase accessory sulfurtransferase FdhD n=1 Tax=Acinetobacter TaxID=469 RepID=UPI00051BEEC5|nr:MULTISPECIES: formate dehydrogenase accessory sulfurtransferase FdhD [unclassified Acinetobacter]MCH7378136.1 formate dehydrogenase accessory sulfurtransferase FdhD [Acinetobacter higginsii]MCJ0827983.1 formate dehydrogenase accessory sulfurtransferase FdhD [Acinetobacter sp. NIPH1876]
MDTKTRGYETMQVHRFHREISENELDYIVQEYPVALIYNGISHAVMMATPSDLEVFAKGFSLSEGILQNLSELYSLDIRQNELGVEVDMTISSRAFMALKAHRRMMVGRTGCGLCGIESLKQLYANLPAVSTHISSTWLSQIPNAIAQLKVRQKISELTGGAHAAAWVVKGQIVALFEDVGRHNALDKLLGYLAEQKMDVAEGFVVMTSRASYELIRKCVQSNIALLATISAPTSMAIEMAKQLNLTLASFCRGESFVLYTE